MGKSVMLIADDVEMNRSVIKRFLGREYEVLEAENGREALEILKSRKVDMLLLDIIMPEINGMEVLRCVKEELKLDDMGILVATSTKEKTERQALQLGADDIVAKPYDPTVIKKRMENIAAKKQIEREVHLYSTDELKKQAKEEYVGEMRNQLEEGLARISKLADMVEENASNPDVVKEFAGHIRQKAEEVTKLVY